MGTEDGASGPTRGDDRRAAERGAARRIVEFDGSDWVVRSVAGERASLRTADRGTAVARAKAIVRHLGGGEVEVREKSGSAAVVATVAGAPRHVRR